MANPANRLAAVAMFELALRFFFSSSFVKNSRARVGPYPESHRLFNPAAPEAGLSSGPFRYSPLT